MAAVGRGWVGQCKSKADLLNRLHWTALVQLSLLKSERSNGVSMIRNICSTTFAPNVIMRVA
jgi:hypothetical protein